MCQTDETMYSRPYFQLARNVAALSRPANIHTIVAKVHAESMYLNIRVPACNLRAPRGMKTLNNLIGWPDGLCTLLQAKLVLRQLWLLRTARIKLLWYILTRIFHQTSVTSILNHCLVDWIKV